MTGGPGSVLIGGIGPVAGAPVPAAVPPVTGSKVVPAIPAPAAPADTGTRAAVTGAAAAIPLTVPAALPSAGPNLATAAAYVTEPIDAFAPLQPAAMGQVQRFQTAGPASPRLPNAGNGGLLSSTQGGRTALWAALLAVALLAGGAVCYRRQRTL